jgi:hypothetical protein
MGACLLQADPDSDDAALAELQEMAGGTCMFDLTKRGLRLRPLAFLSRATTKQEKAYHSYIGEVSTGRYAFDKSRKFLIGAESTWLTDCSGLNCLSDIPKINYYIQVGIDSKGIPILKCI